jgi:phenylacetaldehyde dehydrogenase
VIVDVDQRHRLVQEEIFGPVLVAMPFDDIDEVVRMANDNPYGWARASGPTTWPRCTG